jgi:proteic killer suppression protein
VIVSFRHKGLKLFYETGSTRGVQAHHAAKLKLVLSVLQFARTPKDLERPTFRAHPLKGVRNGFWSVWVNGNWRVTCRFVEGGVELVDYEDYH